MNLPLSVPSLRLRLAALLAALATTAHAQTIPDALDAPSLPWFGGGFSAWIGQTTNTHDGVDAGRSGVITHEEECYIETQVEGPGTLSFWWRVSSEANYDFLEFHTNGVLARRISGAGGAYTLQSFNLSEPLVYTLRWRYTKDDSVNAGQDAGYLDEVIFIIEGPPTIVTQPQSQLAPCGSNPSFPVGFSGTVESAQWMFNGTDLPGGTNVTLVLSNVSPASAGNYFVRLCNSSGCVTSAPAALTINPNVPLTLSCPGNFTVPTEFQFGGVVNYSATANNPCDPTIGVSCAPPSGSQFSLGLTSVSCTATNGAGASQSCTFQVLVALCSSNFLTVDVDLPDNDSGGISSTISVLTPIEVVTDVNVSLVVTGTYNGDLHAVLTHNGVQAVLLNRPGRRAAWNFGYDDDGLDIRLDDQAPNGDVHVYRLVLTGDHALPLTGGIPLTGVWAPDGRPASPTDVLDTDSRPNLLGIFNGINPNGDWTLQIADWATLDYHRLVSWSLDICGDPAGPPPALVFTSIQYDAGAGSCTLTWRSQFNAVYEVEASTDLGNPANWEPIALNVASQGQSTTYTDTTLPTPQIRFYRVKKL